MPKGKEKHQYFLFNVFSAFCINTVGVEAAPSSVPSMTSFEGK